MKHILATCKKHKVAAGVHCFSAEEAQARIEEGWQFIAIGSELRMMLDGVKNELDRSGTQGRGAARSAYGAVLTTAHIAPGLPGVRVTPGKPGGYVQGRRWKNANFSSSSTAIRSRACSISVVAYDAGADAVLSYGGVTAKMVRDKVHGAIFTARAEDLKHTAIFIGGSNVTLGEKLLAEVRKHMLPQYGLSVSVLLDPNGVEHDGGGGGAGGGAAPRSQDDEGAGPGATGPVGRRVALLLARQGAEVRVGSREASRAESVAESILRRGPRGENGGRRPPIRPATYREP